MSKTHKKHGPEHRKNRREAEKEKKPRETGWKTTEEKREQHAKKGEMEQIMQSEKSGQAERKRGQQKKGEKVVWMMGRKNRQKEARG